MADLIYLAVLVAFFAIATLFVFACDKIIGSDDVALSEGLSIAPTPKPDAEPRQVAA